MPSQISQMRSGQMMPYPQLNEAYINQLKQLMRSENAVDYLTKAFAANPQLQNILQMFKTTDNPQMLYETIARQMGVDPNYLINKLMS